MITITNCADQTIKSCADIIDNATFWLLLKATFPNAKIEYAPEGLCLQVEFPAVGDLATL